MPFDGHGFSGGGRGTPRGPSDNAVSVLIVAIALTLLLLPISLGVLADVVAYLRR